jgi:hypothetical protein
LRSRRGLVKKDNWNSWEWPKGNKMIRRSDKKIRKEVNRKQE